MDEPREIALNVLNRVEDGAWASELLPGQLAGGDLDERDRRFVTELVNGTLRRRLQLDFLLGRLCRYPLEELDRPVRNILRLGAYQIMHMRVPAHAACDESVRLVRRTGPRRAAGLVNAVLRNLVRLGDSPGYPDREDDPAGWIAITESHPRWIVQTWLEEMGFCETLSLCRADNEAAGVDLRVNVLRISPGEAVDRLQKRRRAEVAPCGLAPHGLQYSGGGSPFSLPEYDEGLISVQSESSQLGALALGVGPGMRALDACAGRGGKTTYLAQLMENAGEVLAADRHRFKLEVLGRECERLGVGIVRTLCADARELPDVGSFDAVLVDAPCSGLGILRRHPDARWRKTPGLLERMPALQRQLLDSLSSLVRLGGHLVYCTCSISRCENEGMAEWFLREHPDFVPAEFPPGFPGFPDSPGGMLQLLPHIHGTDGFFIARFRRRQEG
ncbi:MAG: 16S rRNA (cytosine(967)-C(5))-methyltransferase RsmB, partial [Bacillota bacterium]